MKKPLLGMVLGAGLGVLDGLSALATAPEDPQVRADIVLIVAMGVFKGLVAGFAIGSFSRRFRSLPLGLLAGLAIGVALAAPIALLQGKYYWQIMGPGGLVGLILGYATQRYGEQVIESG